MRKSQDEIADLTEEINEFKKSLKFPENELQD